MPARKDEPAPASAMMMVRQGTRAAHESLESAVDLSRLAGSREGYAQTIKAFYGIYAVLEPVLWNAVPWVVLELAPGPRRKLPLLVDDLTAFDIDHALLPLCERIPDVATVPRALGALYVLEGSTLGGKVITRELRKSLGLESRFFSSYGAEVGPMWREFTGTFDRFMESNVGLAETVATANETFLLFEQWLTRTASS